MARVSILMATYNRAHLIERTLGSILDQSFGDWELIVADDGSTDNTEQVIAGWQKKEPRIVYTKSESNVGISKNYNRGLRLAKGEYVAMIDDDDPWMGRDSLEKKVKFLDQNKEYAGVGGGVVVIDTEGRELYRYLKPEKDEAIRRYALFSNPMANSTTLFRMDAARKVGFYDESTRYSGDRDFWLKMGLVGKLCNFPEYFSYYTMSGSNTSVAKMRPHLKASFMVMRRYKGKYPHYYAAYLLNAIQYLYSFMPVFVKNRIHYLLARAKRLLVK